MRYVYMGQEGEFIPLRATHIIVHESVVVIRAWAFFQHLNIVEVICHEDVEKIENRAFAWCDSLTRVIMPGVTIVEEGAFYECIALTDVECGKLEIIRNGAFYCCRSLRIINLPSARIVGSYAFSDCESLMDATFGCKLERIEESAFCDCTPLERITIPLKNDLIPHDYSLFGCENLNRVDLVEGEILRETIAALQLEEWRNDMHDEIDTINQILPTTDVGEQLYDDVGEKALVIRRWIRSVLRKIMHYKAHHRRLLEEDVAPTLHRILPQDIVMNNFLPFLEVPSHSFEVEHHEDEVGEQMEEDE